MMSHPTGGRNNGGGHNREGGGYNREGGGYNRDGGGYNRDGGGYNRDGGGYGGERRNSRPQQRSRISKMRSSNDPLPANNPFLDETGEALEELEITGVLEMHPNGYGFLRDPAVTYTRQLIDPFVPGNMIEKYSLREGVMCKALAQPGRKNQGPRIKDILEVEGNPPEEFVNVRTFDELTAITPDSWYRLETGVEPISTRVMDLLTPGIESWRQIQLRRRNP